MGEPFYHDASLQRLGVFHPHDGKNVYYSPESFSNAGDWENIPIIYQATTGDTIAHPDFDAVINGTLPATYTRAGYVAYGYIPEEGEPRLCSVLAITDPAVEQLARDGRLAISTGFAASRIGTGDGTEMITGSVKPNHVFVFERGACPSCWSNDGGAMFLNTAEEEKPMTAPIDTETRGWIKQIKDVICNTAEKQPRETPEQPEKQNMDETKKIEELAATNAQLAAENAQLKAAAETRVKDEMWNTVKATAEIPAGWLGVKESETRAKFENNKDAFYLELMQHKAKLPHANTAEGSCACGDPEEERLVNVRKIEKEAGIVYPEN